jgi:hypothetical protein
VSPEERRAANEEAVRGFFARWDPAWRWILILGMRELRSDPARFGALAAAEANGNESWSEDEYVYGPVSHGITAAAVNEAVQHCEDLFALLRFLRDPQFFARDMTSYKAGQVVAFGRRYKNADDEVVSRLFLVPNQARVREGLAAADDPGGAIEAVEAGRARLGTLFRETVAFYFRFEQFHLQYKHGLKLPLRPFGTPTPQAIAERKTNVRGPIFVYTNESLAAQARRSPEQQAIMFHAGPAQQAHLPQLVAERNLMRLHMVADVDFDQLVERSHMVMRLLEFAETNRLSLGTVDEDGSQSFALPGPNRWEQMNVSLGLDEALALDDFA